jgi:hypothetical protein
MKNETNIKVPKKYHNMLDNIYHDNDGYWAEQKVGYSFGGVSKGETCYSAHEDTVADLLKEIRTLRPCTCKYCVEHMKK